MFRGAGIFLLLIFLGGSLQASAAPSCQLLLKVELSSPKERPLRFMSYNVLNLFLHQGKYVWGENGQEKVNQDHMPNQKPEEQTRGVAAAILTTRPDFLILQEVEGRDSLHRFNDEYLGSDYQVFMPPTNDSRGIGVAFLIRKNVDVRVEVGSASEHTWVNPTGREEKVFSRNFPVFKIFKPRAKEPSLIIAGVHFKSQRDRKGDPNSYLKRQTEMEHAVQILERMKRKHSNSPIVVMGDFNASRGDKEVMPIFEKLGFFDPHLSEMHFEDIGGLGRTTHTYHPFIKNVEQPAVRNALDRALLSRRLLKYLKKSAIYRYRVLGSATKKRIPESYSERDENPSDHYPIYFDLDPSIIFD
ncbi:MAG: endonuclease/exonuclease/phosphatase family protein [Bdellovibrionales bacterium]